MQIIIEGPDGSGKSTLIKRLQEATGWHLIPGEGPEKYPGEMEIRIKNLVKKAKYRECYGGSPVIYDRHSCVSHPIYSKYTGKAPVAPELIEDFYSLESTFIFCVPPSDLLLDGDAHQVKATDTQEHLEAIHKQHTSICKDYYGWAMERAHHVYRYWEPGALERIIHVLQGLNEAHRGKVRAPDFVEDLRDFHIKFGLEYLGKPRALPQEFATLRHKLGLEEVNEYYLHNSMALIDLEEGDRAGYTLQLAEILDALVDQQYVLTGTILQHGLEPAFNEAWRRVHKANMSKVKASSAGDSKRNSRHDIVKPEGWIPPTHDDLVEENDLE